MIKINARTNKDNIKKLIDIEVSSINVSLAVQKTLSKQILSFLKNFLGNIDVESIIPVSINDFISEATKNLSKIKINIDYYTNLLEILDNIEFNIDTLEFKSILAKISQYNKKNDELLKHIFIATNEIQSFVQSMSLFDISGYISLEKLDKVLEPVVKDDNPKKKNKNTKKSNLKNEPYNIKEDTLIISEKDKMVILPYKIGDLKNILRHSSNKYSSLSDVIADLYTKPIKDYRYSAISRFREAYKLIIEREHGTKKEALSLATELFSNYNLHPAIITACKNLNELDIYLSCLEYNELEDFHFFKVIYEALPTITKKKEVFE